MRSDIRALKAASLISFLRITPAMAKLTLPPAPMAPFKQRRNPAANARRKVKAEIGARQYRKQCKALAQLTRDL